MKLKATKTVMLAAIGILVFSVFAQAETIVDYNLSVPTGDLGTTQYTYGTNPHLLPINGVKTNDAPNFTTGTWNVTNGVATNLYGKVSPGDPGETGLGLKDDPDGDNEVWDQPNAAYQWGFLMVDVTNLKNDPNLLYFQMRIGSAQTHEWYTVWGSTAANPNTATLLMEGQGGNDAQSPWFDVPNYTQYKYIWIGAVIQPGSGNDHSDVTLESQIAFTDQPIPEPGTLALLGSGLAGTAGILRRKSAA